MQSTELLTVVQAAERLGVVRTAIYKRINSGSLVPAMRLPSPKGQGAFLFHREDVEALAVKKEAAQ